MTDLPSWALDIPVFDPRLWYLPVVCMGRAGNAHPPEMLAIVYERSDGLGRAEGGPGMLRERVPPAQGPLPEVETPFRKRTSTPGSFNFACLRGDCDFNARVPRDEWAQAVKNAERTNAAFVAVSMRD